MNEIANKLYEGNFALAKSLVGFLSVCFAQR